MVINYLLNGMILPVGFGEESPNTSERHPNRGETMPKTLLCRSSSDFYYLYNYCRPPPLKRWFMTVVAQTTSQLEEYISKYTWKTTGAVYFIN